MCSGSENYNRKTSKREAKCRGGEWSSKNSGSHKILAEFHVLCAVMCVSQSRFLYEGVSESRFFLQGKGVLKFRLIYFLMTSSRHSVLNFIKATCNFQETVNPNFS